MADKKISELTSIGTTPANDDVLPIVDTSDSTTKKVTYSDLTGTFLESVTEADLSLSDNTTADADNTKHGFCPKMDGSATSFLDGTGAFSVPSCTVELISEQSITTNPTSISFTSIASGYDEFIIDIQGIYSSADSGITLWLNNDNGANRYLGQSIRSYNGNNLQGAALSSTDFNITNGSAVDLNTEASFQIKITNNADRYKGFVSMGYYTNNNAQTETSIFVGHYNQTTEISRIDIDMGGVITFGNTRIRLFGITGA